MNSETLSMWGNGAVTLPKAWREQFPTKHFIAVVTPTGLLIKPILDIESFETDAEFGLRFPMGMEAGDLAARMRKAMTSPRRRKARRRHG